MRGATQFGPSLREQLRLALRISGRLFALIDGYIVSVNAQANTGAATVANG